MKQSMSRVAHCIDNGPMEGFWGILKRETYYGRRFTSKTDLINAMESYIYYYNTERIQRKPHSFSFRMHLSFCQGTVFRRPLRTLRKGRRTTL